MTDKDHPFELVSPYRPTGDQPKAIEKLCQGLDENKRWQVLLGATGTGKTFTSLKIAEKETDNNGLILFLVPSIALLGQTLREWTAQADKPIYPICICSDAKSTQKELWAMKNTDRFGISLT